MLLCRAGVFSKDSVAFFSRTPKFPTFQMPQPLLAFSLLQGLLCSSPDSTIVLCLRAVKSKRCVINPAVPQDHMKTQPRCCDAQRGGWSMVPTLSERGLFGSVAAGRCWSHHADWGRIQAFIRHLQKCGNCESVGFGHGH